MDTAKYNLKDVLTSIWTKIIDALSSAQGWAVAAVIAMTNFFAGYTLSFLAVAVAIAFDTLFGIAVAHKQGRFILSELMWRTVFKIAVCLNILIVCIFIDKLVSGSGFECRFTAVVVSIVICMAETWSSLGHATIIHPRLPLLRIFRKALAGEIARKLGMTPDEVNNYLDSNTKTDDDHA